MGLMPAQFWALTVREFWIKHAAFHRAEGRAESLLIHQALRTKSYKPKDANALKRQANVLKRYPVKPWLKSP